MYAYITISIYNNKHAWYQDDSVFTGPRLAVFRALSIIQERGPALGLFINVAKCKLFSLSDLSMFPSMMKTSHVPHFEILGAPIGDAIFCATFVSQICAMASSCSHSWRRLALWTVTQNLNCTGRKLYCGAVQFSQPKLYRPVQFWFRKVYRCHRKIRR